MKIKKLRTVFLIIMLISSWLIGCEKSPSDKDKNQIKDEEKKIVNETSDFRYDIMKKQINQLIERYSGIKSSTFGTTVYNRDLYLLKLGRGAVKVGVVGGVHGREGITSLLILRLLEDYASNLEQEKKIGNYNVKELLNKVTFYFIPMLNPDGIEIAIKGPPLDKKDFYIKANEGSQDFERWKANGRGVDLNKQFRADWEEVESTLEPHFESYKGPAPESEPESRALADLTRKEKFAAVVAFHSSGSVIFWYYNQIGQAYQRDYGIVKSLARINGYKIIDPEESDKRAAGYKDWFIKEFKKPGFTIEVGEGKSNEPLPSSLLSRYFQENRLVLLKLAEKLL